MISEEEAVSISPIGTVAFLPFTHPFHAIKRGKPNTPSYKDIDRVPVELETKHEWGSQGMNYEEDETESNVVSLDSYRNWKQYLAWKNPPKTKEDKIKEALAKAKR
ncbi:MAG: hypothetical protein H7249_15775 [Chitinophagaceae bacterium]|nr:hypothetical protein [Oligoflexus sp.]